MLLIDIGSTYTKLAVLDESSKRLIATAYSPTTIEDVSVGFNHALDKIKNQSVPDDLLYQKYACSSAAGGLRMIAVGLVPELTVEAAKRAALGAGAKVIGAYSFLLMNRQVSEIEAIKPDIILLAGGTDGGDRKTVVHNAERIASSKSDAPVVFAGNREAADRVENIFEQVGKEIHLADNVMPTVSKINVDSVREIIREVFLKKIIVAKGLDKINQFINAIVFPTPVAVLEASKTFARVTHGGVVVVDVGGATTDVHSVAEGNPHDPQVVLKGLPEPYAKRTVEGDLGVRHNISTIVNTVGKKEFLANSKLAEDLDLERVDGLIELWSRKTSALPDGDVEERFDRQLAACAVEIAMNRHVGYLEEMWTPMGKVLVQYGKDLTATGMIIGVGGPIVYSSKPREILEKALYDVRTPLLLKPQNPRIYVDSCFILFAIGLISKIHPEIAEGIAWNYLNQMRLI